MIFARRLSRIRRVYHEYPQQFWILIGAAFIDHVGGALLFPFFSLYITARFGVGMTTVGVLFGIYSVTAVVGSSIGGALTDRLGRKAMLIFGLVASAGTSLLMGFAGDLRLFFAAAVFVGLFANSGEPAQQAMIADLLPERQRVHGYGLSRVVANLAVTIGPALGGMLAARSYLILFIADAVTSVVTAVIVFLIVRETRPERTLAEKSESFLQTFRGYGVALADKIYMAFIFASMITALVYMQMNTTLAVFLRDIHHFPPQGYGYLLSMNAALVVLFQFPITRRLSRYPSMAMMALGSVLLAVGFGMYAFVTSVMLFFVAMIVLTVGEMIVIPEAQAVVARLAPETMRGRYMAVYGLSWTVPTIFGPTLAGAVMDYWDPRWVWHGALLFGLAAAAIYGTLFRYSRRRRTS
ncbi:MAG: MFS transporter [Caldilineae bacterium]|nr:MAG: MFS transporter [Caldilineae bacterium]